MIITIIVFVPLHRALIYAILTLGAALLAACTHTVINNNGATPKMDAPDIRSNRAIEKLLPDSAFSQKEFPKTYVIGLMRNCLDSVKERHSVTYEAKKGDALCACETDARVNGFSLQEYIEASQAGWDPRLVPEAAKKSAKIISDCLQKVLQ